jgi:hypothetical protein
LEAKLEALRMANVEINKEHIVATNENQAIKKEFEEMSANMSKESALNKVLGEKTATERAILDFN